MKIIELTKGLSAIIDHEDFDLISGFKWCVKESGGGKFYAIATRNNQRIRMHRLICGLPPKGAETVDHINGDSLDNRRANLRICSQAQNCRNRRKDKRNTSGYKGCVWDKVNKKWSCTITYNYRTYRIGRFNTKEESALAYDQKAKELFGEFANLNFPEK